MITKTRELLGMGQDFISLEGASPPPPPPTPIT